MYRNALLTPKKPAPYPGLLQILCSLWKAIFSSNAPPDDTSVVQGQSDAETKPLPFFHSRLQFDLSSFDWLLPNYPYMPYYLAFYHLDCARRNLDPKTKVALISELSCSGKACFRKGGPEYTWSSDIYVNNGTFLQKQDIHCMLDDASEYKFLPFVGCPHNLFAVRRLSFNDGEGSPAAKACLDFSPLPDYKSVETTDWDSQQGRFVRLQLCGSCHSDLEQILEVIDNKLHIRVTSYRDLGSGKDPSQPTWAGHLSMSGSRRYDDHVYGRVWRTAKELERPNLQPVIHEIGLEEDNASVGTH
ncbi:hypothetical protein KJ359_007090 [Pestalotiopsis sp. 9143b]|nr:hypothetical protein KJ359_007090 [Pestalotiopsis sp. 9143b]